MNLRDQILAVAEAHSAVTRLSIATLSTRIYGDGSRLPKLQKPRGPREKRKDMLSGSIEIGLQWFSDNWPEGAVWPCSVTRPAPAALGSAPSPEVASAT